MQQLQQGDGGSLEEKVDRPHPPKSHRGTCRETPPNHPNRAAARPAPRSARALILLSRPRAPPHGSSRLLFPTRPSQQPTGAHTAEDAWGASSRRPHKRVSAPGVSFRTHTGYEYWSTVNGVLGWNLPLLSRINAHISATVHGSATSPLDSNILWIPTSFGTISLNRSHARTAHAHEIVSD